MEKTNLVENKIDFRCLIVRKKLEIRKKKPCLTGFLRIAYTSSTKKWLKKTSMGGIWSFIWIPASGFVLFSLFRHWVNVPRPYEKWDIQPLLEKNSSGHSFPSRHVFSATIISMCVCQLSLPLGMCSMLLSLLLALVRVLGGVHYPKDVLVAWGLGLAWGGLFWLV